MKPKILFLLVSAALLFSACASGKTVTTIPEALESGEGAEVQLTSVVISPAKPPEYFADQKMWGFQVADPNQGGKEIPVYVTEDKISWEPKPNDVVAVIGSTTEIAEDVVIDAERVDKLD